MANRFTATVSSDFQVRTNHWAGAPPEAGTKDTRTAMPKAAKLTIEESQSGVFLYRFSEIGEFAGDTWHATVEEAKEQATFEFGGALTPWIALEN
jgi:hypothetical protein